MRSDARVRICRGTEVPPRAAWEGGKPTQVLSKGYVRYAVGVGRGSLPPSSARGAGAEPYGDGWLV